MKRRYATGTFVAALSCFFASLIVSGMSEDANKSVKRGAMTTTERTLSAESISTLNLYAPAYQRLSFRVEIEFADVKNMTIKHERDREKHSRFDLQGLSVKRENEALTLDLGQETLSDEHLTETLKIFLPRKDWHVHLSEKSDNFQRITVNNQHTPINLVINTPKLKVTGTYKTLTVWQTEGEGIRLHDANIAQLILYSVGLRLYALDSVVAELSLHAPEQGALETNLLALLQKITWQRLTSEEANTLKQLNLFKIAE